jgi:hypothetical protein
VFLASLTEKPEGVFLEIGGVCVSFRVEAGLQTIPSLQWPDLILTTDLPYRGYWI